METTMKKNNDLLKIVITFENMGQYIDTDVSSAGIYQHKNIL